MGAGISCEGPLRDLLAQIDAVFPLNCDVSGDRLTLGAIGEEAPLILGAPTVTTADDGFGERAGFVRRTSPGDSSAPRSLRYYDIDRDYQPGLQIAPTLPQRHQPAGLDFPASLSAAAARERIDVIVRSAGWSRQALSWRTAEIDPRVRPGSLVRVPDQPGVWRVTDWEWRSAGVELSLLRVPVTRSSPMPADPGTIASAVDAPLGVTVLAAFEMPWDGSGPIDAPAIYAAVSSPSSTWSGAALYLDSGDGHLQPIGASGRRRSVVGRATTALAPASPLLFDRATSVTIQLVAEDLMLGDSTARQMAMGANRALLGEEIIQFARALPLGGGTWRLEGLLRGRGGTENAISGHAVNDTFVLLDEAAVPLSITAIGTNPLAVIVGMGVGDNAPATSTIAARGLALRPLSPVHPQACWLPDGGLVLRWTRRARGAWAWLDQVDTPLHEESEVYDVTIGLPDGPAATWTVTEPFLSLPPNQLSPFLARPGSPVLVRQRGSYASSDPLLLTYLA